MVDMQPYWPLRRKLGCIDEQVQHDLQRADLIDQQGQIGWTSKLRGGNGCIRSTCLFPRELRLLQQLERRNDRVSIDVRISWLMNARNVAFSRSLRTAAARARHERSAIAASANTVAPVDVTCQRR